MSAATTIRFEGHINNCSLSQTLHEIQESYSRGVRDFTIELKSQGGHLGVAMNFIERLHELDGATIRTLVKNGDQCASSCVPIFMSGHHRVMKGASTLYLHGLHHERQSRAVLRREASCKSPLLLGPARYTCSAIEDRKVCLTKPIQEYYRSLYRVSPKFAARHWELLGKSPKHEMTWKKSKIADDFPGILTD